jgi:hypothetical protein
VVAESCVWGGLLTGHIPSHPSLNLKVQQLTKEQQQCHKEVSCSLSLP